MTEHQFASIMSALMSVCVLIGVLGMALATKTRGWPWWLVFLAIVILYAARQIIWEFRR